MIVTQTVLALPIVIALTHRIVEGLWATYGDALIIDGASQSRSAATLLAMGRGGLVTVFLSAFGRVIAEVGAILIVGGNIRGFTRSMTTAIALETSAGDLPLALALGLILIFLSIGVSAAAKGSALGNFHIRMLIWIDQHDTILIEKPPVALNKNGKIAAVLKR